MEPTCAQPTDGDLLDAFVQRRDEAAFALLERRHGASVLCACRRMLGRGQDAEDAAQTAFIALATKASSLTGQASVAAWLHHVAWCACIDLQRQSSTRARHEREAMPNKTVHLDDQDGDGTRLAALFDEALGSVPEKFRTPVILHHLQNHAHDEGAQLLGCKVGTFASRLSRGRDLLRAALLKRGVPLSLAALAGFLSQQAMACELPPPVPLSDPAAMAHLLASRPLPSGMGTSTQGAGGVPAAHGSMPAGAIIAGAALIIVFLLAGRDSAPATTPTATVPKAATGAGVVTADRAPPRSRSADKPVVAAQTPTAATTPDRQREAEAGETTHVYAGLQEPDRMPMLYTDRGVIGIGTLDESILSIDQRPARFAELIAGETVRVRWQVVAGRRQAVSLVVQRSRAVALDAPTGLDF